ncbi:MAG: FAD-dependent oxidoreductase [Alphaproteobacteria bacterium]
MHRPLTTIDLADNTGAALTSDVCIVGSGPAGGFLAASLAANGHDVMLLEAGNDSPDMSESELVASMDITGAKSEAFGFSRQVGGSSNLWAGRTAPLEAIDFEHRDWVPDSGWPVTRAELDDYYDQAARIISLPDEDHDPRDGLLALSDELCDGPLETKSFLWSAPPFKIADYLRAQADSFTGGLTLVQNARVRSLHELPSGRAVDAVEALTPSGQTVRIGAHVVVLAAGGLETPRILLNSTAVRPSGIGNDHDAVGRYFSTHPKADMAMLVLNRRVPVTSAMFTDVDVGGGRLRYGLGLGAAAQREHRCLNHYVQLSPFLEYRANRLFERIKNEKALSSSLIDSSAVVRGMLPGLGLMAFEAIGRVARLQRRARMFVLRGFLDQYPDRGNRVRLSGQQDRFGRRMIDVHWRFTERDRQSVLDFLSVLDREMRARNVGHLEFGGLRDKADWPITGIHSHFMGTTRMGESDRNAVVDRDCKVFGYDNLFVSGPSTFSAYGYANPFLTIAALALRLADHLDQRMHAHAPTVALTAEA